MSIILFYVDYHKSKVGAAPSPAPTITVYRVPRSTGTEDGTPVANAAAMTASALAGRYFYRLTTADLQTYDYHARATTSDTSVDDREPPALWVRWSEAVTTDASGNAFADVRVINGDPTAAAELQSLATDYGAGELQAGISYVDVVQGDVNGKVLGGGSNTIIGTGVRADVASFTAGALAQFFTLATGQTWAGAVAQSVVYEIGAHPTAGTVTTNSTVYSNVASLIPIAALLARVDQRQLAEWCSDSDTAVAISDLATNANLAACALDATGEVEAYASVGKRYAPSDLALIAVTTSAAQGRLFRLLARLTTCFAFERRSYLGDNDKGPPYWEWVEARLEALAKGEQIFGILQNAAAGLPQTHQETSCDVEARGLAQTQFSRLFGRRGNQTWHPRE